MSYYFFYINSVLISMNEILKISDFGTCRQLNDISTKMSFAGTVAWMAPEVIRHDPCSEKVDIWLVFAHLQLFYYGCRLYVLYFIIK